MKKHKDDIFEESKGAIIYDGEKDGLTTWVFLTGEGNPTYSAKDLALAAKKLLGEGHFKAGSMGPKMEAALSFVEAGGERAIITSLNKAVDALAGKTGTHIVPN